MYDNNRRSSLEIPLTGVPDLYLIILRFRFPPMNLIQEAPNILTYIPFHADSLLLFADIVKDYGDTDWRFDFVKASYFRKFDKEYPGSLKVSEEHGVALSSVVLPVLRRTSDALDLYLPTRHPHILVITIRNNVVHLRKLRRTDASLRQERLWIRKRDDISKLALVDTYTFELEGLKSNINTRSGGYRAIDVSLKIPLEYMSTELAFFASVNSYEKLQEELSMLKRSGIGKKRDMGFGDLISWETYRVELDNKCLNIRDPMLLYNMENNIIRLITLRNLSATIFNMLRKPKQKRRGKGDELLFLPINIKIVLSRTKPPYWLRQELCLMPFSEFLLRIRGKH